MYNINIKDKRIMLSLYYKFIIFFYFIVVSIPNLHQSRTVFWSAIGLILISIYLIIKTIKVNINFYLIWLCLFSFILIASNVWAVSSVSAIEGTKNLLTTFPIFIFISLFIKTEKDFYEVLKVFLYSQIVTVIFIFMTIDISTVGVIVIGKESLGEFWNANTIGVSMSISALIAFYLIHIEDNRLAKILYCVFILLYIFTSIMTGSRKSFFVIVFTLSLFYILISGNKKILRIRIIVFAVCSLLFLILIMNVPSLYNIIGSGIESLIMQLTGHGEIDRSTTIRTGMIEFGLDLFQSRPFLGYGINSFRAMSPWKMYSHNNYIELLTSIGLIGIIIYYSAHIYIIKNTIKFSNNPFLIFAFVSIITIFIMDLGMVSFNVYYIQFLLCLSFSAVQLSKIRVKEMKNT